MMIPHFVECHPERRTAFSLLRLRSLHVVGQRWSQGAAMEHNALVHVVWSHESAYATPRSLTTRRHTAHMYARDTRRAYVVSSRRGR